MAEFIPAEEFEEIEEEEKIQTLEVPDWEATLTRLSDKPGTHLTIPRNKEFSRKQVVESFQMAFDLIGGVPRLALWAHQNETEFYKLYSRLLPSQASSALGETNEMIVKHVLPRTALDE